LSREAKIEEEFYRLTKNVLEKRYYVIENVRFGDPEPQYPVDSGTSDLMVPTHLPKPLLITEFKRKIPTAKGLKVLRDIDPLGSKVITQALTYAVQCGAPFFATTNGKIFALFTTPERGEAFRIDRHRLLVKEIQLVEETVEEILQVVARWYRGIKVERTTLDWTFILRLRSFVEWLSNQMLSPVQERLKADVRFKEAYTEFSEEVGGITHDAYSREAAYILMNKVVFYKILERYYGNLSMLKPIPPKNGVDFSSRLREYFEGAIVVTKDFEPIFKAGFYDEAPLPDDTDALDEINAFIHDMETYKLEEIGSDVVGFIYERLIPDEERHQLGQFYTPPQIAEFIARWTIREPTDRVLDPACGSGTFLVKAYGRLRELKPLASESIHKEILGQLYAIDINSFPAQISAMNLAMRDVRHPTSEMNVVVEDFFKTMPNQEVLAPFTIRTPEGEVRRRILIPLVNVVVANPPYTRWLEISESTRRAINTVIGETLQDYDLGARIRAGVETGIYMHFVIHASKFLSEGARLGMIISNSWLQTDSGVNFAKFLRENFKIKAVVDFAARLFTLPLVATCVILLEKSSDPEGRNENQTVFLYVDKEATVEELLEAIQKPKKYKERFLVTVARQRDIPGDEKWLTVMFNLLPLGRIFEKMPRLGEFCDTTRGTIEYAALESRGLGANQFFYIDKETMQRWNLREFVVPVVTSPRYTRFFTFSEPDWNRLRERKTPCYLFLCRKPRNSLPTHVLEYIRWGETECKVWYDKNTFSTCSETQACKEREKDKKRYRGWFDVGGVRKASFFTSYYAQYTRRFNLMKFPVTLDADFIAFAPKKRLTQTQIKALLAYLNSSFGQFQVERKGRATGGGMLSLEVDYATNIAVPNVMDMDDDHIETLANAFEELEDEARRLGGADRRGNVLKLRKTIEKIDGELARALAVPKDSPSKLRKAIDILRERRLARVVEARPEVIRGDEAPRIRPPIKARRGSTKEDRFAQPLERWTR